MSPDGVAARREAELVRCEQQLAPAENEDQLGKLHLLVAVLLGVVERRVACLRDAARRAARALRWIH